MNVSIEITTVESRRASMTILDIRNLGDTSFARLFFAKASRRTTSRSPARRVVTVESGFSRASFLDIYNSGDTAFARVIGISAYMHELSNSPGFNGIELH